MVALARPPRRQLDPSGLRARRDVFHMLEAGEWLRLLDLRYRPPNSLLADPLPFAAACIGRLRLGKGREISATDATV